MLLKTTMSYCSKCPSSKNIQTINARERVEKREPSCTVGENVNWCNHYGKQYEGSSKKLTKELTYNPAIPLLGVFSRKTKPPIG